MKKLIILLLVAVLTLSMVVMGIGCKQDTGAESSDEDTVAVEESIETEEVSEEDAVEAEASGEPFKIGLVTPLTGSDSYTGNLCKNALEMAIAEKGTIQGRPIELITGDGNNNDAAIAEVERLMSVENIKFFLGGYGFSGIPIQATVMKNDGFLFETITWESDLLEEDYPNYFFNAPRDKDYGRVTAEKVLELGEAFLGKSASELKVGIIGVSGFPANMYSLVRDVLIENGCEPVVYEVYDATLSDFTPIIAKLRAAECDVIIPSQFPPDAATFRKTCVSLGYNPPILFATGVAYDGIDFAQNGDAALGCISLTYANPSSNESNAAGLKEFKENFEATYGEVALTHALWMYSGAKIYLDAIDAAGSEDYDAVREALFSVDIASEDTANHGGAKYNQGPNYNIKSASALMVAQWLPNDNGEPELYTVWPEEWAISDAVIPYTAE